MSVDLCFGQSPKPLTCTSPRCRGERGHLTHRVFDRPCGEKSPNLAPSPREAGGGEVRGRGFCLRLAAVLFLLFPLTAHAVTPGEMLADPALEARPAGDRLGTALPRLPEPVDRRFRRLARQGFARPCAREAQGRDERRAGARIRPCPLWRFRAAAPAGEARHAAALGRAVDRAARGRRRHLDGGAGDGAAS